MSVSGLTDVKAIDAGDNFTCAVTHTGDAYCWGNGGSGQLGQNSFTSYSTPQAVSFPSGVSQISAGFRHACAVLDDQSAWCWGDNGGGRLGDGTITLSKIPVQVKDAAGGNLTGVVAVAAGTSHSCAYKTTGDVYCWGTNSNGQVGDGTYTNRNRATLVDGLGDVIAVSAGAIHSCAMVVGGQVFCWGGNGQGRLGDGWVAQTNTPVMVSEVCGVRKVAAGDIHACAVEDKGKVVCWGGNAVGQGGAGDLTVERHAPTNTRDLEDIQEITAGGSHSCAVRDDGQLYCWGVNNNGELGDGTALLRKVPRPIFVDSSGGAPVGSSCTYSEHEGKGYFFCRDERSWTSARSLCASVPGWSLVEINDATENAFVSEGIETTTWIGANDVAAEDAWKWAAGMGEGAQFWQGRGTTYGGGASPAGAYSSWIDSVQPDNAGNSDCGHMFTTGTWADAVCTVSFDYVCEGPPIVKLAVTDASADSLHTCALDANQDVWCWGSNTNGRLGDGTTTQRRLPVLVNLPGLATDVAAGDNFSCAVHSDGSAVCWGGNVNGQLGVGDTSERHSPGSLVSGISTATQISAGHRHACAVLADESVRCWGANHIGQLGNGLTSQSDAPVVVKESVSDAPLGDVKLVSSGLEHNCALQHSGDVYCWGNNGLGRLGDGTTTMRTKAKHVDLPAPAVDVVAALSHTCAALNTGELYCWGDNAAGKLGDGTAVWSSEPVSVGGLLCHLDECPHDPTKDEPGVCDCGIPDDDTDDDNVEDCIDECPWDPTSSVRGPAGCAPACEGTVDDLVPEFECVLERADGSQSAVFTVRNSTACTVAVPPGPGNEVTPDPSLRGQPGLFVPGVQRAIMSPLTGPWPFTWTLGSRIATATPAGPACEHVTFDEDAPVILEPKVDHGGGQTSGDDVADPPNPVPFEIPERIRVSSGNASNGTAELTFVNTGGATVVCTYEGGSSVEEPSTDLEFARGLFVNFVSCSNGQTAGDTASGTHFELEMQGGDPRHTRTTLELHLGPGCSGLLDAPFTPEETVLMREGFNWNTTSAIPETTNEPGVGVVPAMRYALVYVESEEQLALLRQTGLYLRQRPIFPSELDRYAGKCGVIDNQGDLRGQWLFSVMPATVYNMIRQDALSPGGGTGIPSPRVILAAVPAADSALANPDGTLSWRRMRESGFQYFKNVQQSPFFDDIFEFIGDAVESVWEAGTSVVGDIAEFVAGTVIVRFEFQVANRDEAFFFHGSAMDRGWGPGPDTFVNLQPIGVEFELLSWQAGFLPASHWKTFSGAWAELLGHIEIRAAESGGVRSGGLCIHMENPAAKLTSNVIGTEYEYCKFDLEDVLDDFEHDVPEQGGYHMLRVSNHRWNYLTQITDGYLYMREVVGDPPTKQAEVSVGFAANAIGDNNGDRPFTPCLDYPVIKDSASALISAIPFIGVPVAATSEVLFAKDIFFPTAANSNHSRGVPTHEYGHFVMCDVFDHEGELFDLYFNRLTEIAGGDKGENLSSENGLAMESFADFFTSQVVGGVNYPDLPNDGRARESAGMEYCIDGRCLESNYRGTQDGHVGNNPEDRYRDQIARLISTYHDAFDHNLTWRSVARPTNADPFELVFMSDLLWRSPGESGGYQFNAEPRDTVFLPGAAIDTWLHNAAGMTGFSFGMQAALASTMQFDFVGDTWCEVCEVFFPHDPNVTLSSLTHARWEACTTGELGSIVGPPPEPDLRLDAETCTECAFSQVSDPNGECVPCDEDLRERPVGNACVSCDPGFILAPAGNVCLECSDSEITPPMGNTCVPCPPSQRANRATNTCEDCPADAVVDQTNFGPMSCGVFLPDIALDSAPNDLCPDEFWIEVRDVALLGANGASPSDLQVHATGFSPLLGSSCGDQTGSFFQHVEKTDASGVHTLSTLRTDAGNDCMGSYLGNPCPEACIFSFPDILTVTKEETDSTGLTFLRIKLENIANQSRTDVAIFPIDLCPSPL